MTVLAVRGRPDLVGTVRAAGLWTVPAGATAAVLAGLALLADGGRLPAAANEAWVLTVLPLWAWGGAVLLRSAPGHRLGQLLLLVGAASAAAVLLQGWSGGADGALPGATFAVWAGGWVWVLTIVPLLGLLPLLLPDGRLPSRAWWPLPVLVVTSAVLLVLAGALAPGELAERPGTRNPVGLPAAAAGPLAVAGAVGAVLVPLCGLAAVAGLVIRWRRSADQQQERLRLVALGVVPLVGTVGWSTVAPSAAATVAVVVALLGWSVCVVVAAATHRLFDVDVAVSRTVSWLAVGTALLALHVGVVALLGGAVGSSLVATALVAVLFAPARDRVQRRVNAFLFGCRDDPWTSLAHVGRRLEAAGRPHAALQEVVDVLAGSLRLGAVSVLLADGGVDVPEAVLGERRALAGPHSCEQPLIHLGEQVGALRVAPRPGETLGRRDRALLAELAPGVAVVAAGVVSAERLRRSTQDLVAAVEDERRRLRRDLHDGIGPTLTGVAFALEAVRNLVATRPDEAARLLDATTTDLHDAVAELRRAVEGLRPPALDDLGLVAALDQRVRALAAASGLTVELEVPNALPPLPAAVEVAVYRIVVEGVTNAVRHARAGRCLVRLVVGRDVPAGQLCVQVRDDGGGSAAPLRLGAGLLSVRERAEAVGGRSEFTCGAQGSLLEATVPLAGP